jgi:hypothetical protein
VSLRSTTSYSKFCPQILYRIAKVFPPPNMELDSKGKGVYSFAPGVYTYPFDFKVR